MQLIETKDFDRFLKRLARKGGIADAVYKEVMRALVMWAQNEDPKLPRTHHGESRIPHAVKYDLRGHFRLVVYEHAGKRIPLMVGDHDETEHWLDNNRGKDFTINTNTKRVRFTNVTTEADATKAALSDLSVPPTARGPVLAQLSTEVLHRLNIPEFTLKALNAYVTFESVEEDGELLNLLHGLAFPSSEHREVVIQVIALLVKGSDQEAHERIEQFVGNADTASDAPAALDEAIKSGNNSDYFIDLSRLAEEEIRRLVGASGLTDWMLYLHPDQKRLVEKEYSGPARLIGVSGSGKTSVLVHRANYLASKYSGQRVLVLSLNAALCTLIERMLDALCAPSTRAQIDVMTIYEFCYRAVKAIQPDRLIELRDPKSGEDLAACWHDFINKKHATKTAGPVFDALDWRTHFDAWGYIREELGWIRTGFGREDRPQYLRCERSGRGIAFPGYDPATAQKPRQETGGAMPYDARVRMLKLLEDYEEYMTEGGLADFDGVSLEAFTLRQRINEHKELQWRCVLVDEVQDCSTVELAVIAQIPSANPDSLYLTGDPVQKVFPRQCDLVQAGIDIVGRGALLRVNYRNTREILETAFQIITHYKDLAPLPREDILEPSYAFRHGSRPVLYECATPKEQVSLVLWYLSLLTAEEFDATCVASPTERALKEIQEACERAQIPTFRITGETSRMGRIGKGVKLSLLPEIKGYEFRQVYLVDLMDTQLLPKRVAWEERWRIAFQIYVAMTRARDDLVMSYVQNASVFLKPIWDSAKEARAIELLSQ